MKQVLMENGYKESISSKIFKRNTNDYSLSAKNKRKPQISKKKR